MVGVSSINNKSTDTWYAKRCIKNYKDVIITKVMGYFLVTFGDKQSYQHVGKTLVWEEKIVVAATIVSDSRV